MDHPEIGPALAESELAWRKKRRFRHINSISDVNRSVMETILDASYNLAQVGLERHKIERLSRVQIVLVQSEDILLSTRRQSDGGYLITVSDTFTASLGFLLELFQSVEETTCNEDRYAAITAARFHLLGQCMQDISMTIGYNGSPKPSHEKAALIAILFSILHELGHVALDHLEPTYESAADGDGRGRSTVLEGVEKERAADEFAVRALSGLIAAPWERRFRDAAVLGLKIALLTIELRRLGLFIRPATMHDSYDDRVALALKCLPWTPDRDENIDALHGVLQVAADFTCHMADGWWDILRASSSWDTHFREERHTTFISQVDQVLGRPPETNLETLTALGLDQSMTSAVREAVEGRADLRDVTERLGVQDADRITDMGAPLSRQEFIAMFAGAPGCRAHPDTSASRRAVAFVMMELLEPLITRGDIDH